MKSIIRVSVLLVLFSISGCRCNGRPGDGEKIGQIVKINKQGMINKTWEVELIRGGLSGGNGTIGTAPFDFTVRDDKTAAQLKEYMEKQTEVTIHYDMPLIYSISSSDSGHFLTAVEEKK